MRLYYGTAIIWDLNLTTLGMVIVIEKIEIMIMNSRRKNITHNNMDFRIQDKISVLEITFNNKLNWKAYVESLMQKSSFLLSGLKLLRNKVTEKQFLWQLHSIMGHCTMHLKFGSLTNSEEL